MNICEGMFHCTKLVVKRTAAVGRPKKARQNSVSAGMHLLGVDPQVRAIYVCGFSEECKLRIQL